MLVPDTQAREAAFADRGVVVGAAASSPKSFAKETRHGNDRRASGRTRWIRRKASHLTALLAGGFEVPDGFAALVLSPRELYGSLTPQTENMQGSKRE